MTADDSRPLAPDKPEPARGNGASEPSLPAVEPPEEAIERLTRALDEKTAEAARNRDLYVRERADLENYKRRMHRERGEALRFALEPLARDLLPVLDNLERAVEHAAADDAQPLIEGVRLVLKSALGVFARHGITRVDAVGQPFDPTRHEAVAQVADPEIEPNRVVAQFAPGYAIHDRLLRAAQVGVSVKPPVESPTADD